MKIRIFGDIASGKTTLAKKLGKELGASVFSTDNFVYKKKYVTKRSPKERALLVNQAIKKKNWVVEGVHHSEWISSAAQKADIIIVFQVPLRKLVYRIIKRTIFEEKGKRKIRDMLKLIFMLLRDSKKDIVAYKKIAKTKKHIISSKITVEDVKRKLNK